TENLFNAAEYGRLTYTEGGAVLADWVTTAAGKALACGVTEARFIPLKRPFERPDWMPATVARLVANAAMLKLINDGNSPATFDHCLAQVRQPSPVSQGHKILASRLDERLRQSLMSGLGAVMRQYIEPLADAGVASMAIRIVNATVHTYLWHAMNGNQTVVTALKPMVKLLHEICPWAVIAIPDSRNAMIISLVHKLKQPAF
ncbi:MAG: hypothetical protein AAB692_03120, partial [Patescibacteria group bacterium]